MTTNLKTEQDIQRRLNTYPPAARRDIEWLLAETARLADAAADEYKQRMTAEDAATQALLDKTAAQAQVLQLSETIRAQSAEIAELHTRIRGQGDEIATLRGEPGKVVVR